MKRILLILLVGSIFGSFGCAKSEDEDTDPNDNSYKVDYINQDLQGKIEGINWKYILGDVHSSEGGWNSDFTHNFNLVDTAQNDSCFASSGNRPRVIFSIGDDEKALSVGTHKLSFDFGNEDSKTVTMYNPKTNLNIIATQGEYQILSVDTINKIVTGKMDAFGANDSYINGNFTIKYCYW